MRNKSKGARNRARAYRKKPSVAEKVIYAHLKKNLLGFTFHRQYPVGKYVLDLFCAEAKLCIEMDSDLHDGERDKVRDEFLKTQGILTIRIPNVDLLGLKHNPSRDWLQHIKVACQERTGQLDYPPLD